jgi:LCP family protein required for cell wall assembly
MENFDSKKIIHQLNVTRILVFGVIVSLFIGIFGLATNQRYYTQELGTKELQINSLIDEIGELKEDNFNIQNTFTKQNEIILGNINIIEDITNTIGEGDVEVSGLKEKIKAVHEDFELVLTEKEKAFLELQRKNNELQKIYAQIKENQKIITVLLVGTNQNLTDTILLMIINPESEEIVALSIPRDLYINGRKINSIYTLYGISALRDQVADITGLFPDKYVMVDFEGFEKAVELVDGIDVYVRQDLYDKYFPTENNGYTVYEISKGYHHMDGGEALDYARSRKSTSDFDRAKRQQDIIEAIRLKLKTMHLVNDLPKAKELYDIILDYVKTDVTIFEALYYLDEFQNYKMVNGNVLDTTNYLYATRTTKGEYILLPREENYNQIQEAIVELIRK